jgi:metallo-beta-lactamase class B
MIRGAPGAGAPDAPMQKVATMIRWCCAALFLALQGCASGAPAVAPSAPVPAADRAALASLAKGSAPLRIGPALSIQKVAPDTYVVVHEAGLAPANIAVARMPDGSLVLASSPYDTETTRALVRWLREAFHPPRMLTINTHFHPDGTAGNEAFREEGVETYASDLTQELIKSRGAEVREMTARAVGAPLREPMERTRTVPADHTFDAHQGLTLELGGETVQVIYPGPAHSPDNVVVFFPARRVLYAGDIARAAAAGLGYRGDANVQGWDSAVKKLEALAPLVVIPGHGAVGGPELLAHTEDLVRQATNPPQPQSPQAPRP